jgi:hypothetical protein
MHMLWFPELEDPPVKPSEDAVVRLFEMTFNKGFEAGFVGVRVLGYEIWRFFWLRFVSNGGPGIGDGITSPVVLTLVLAGQFGGLCLASRWMRKGEKKEMSVDSPEMAEV